MKTIKSVVIFLTLTALSLGIYYFQRANPIENNFKESDFIKKKTQENISRTNYIKELYKNPKISINDIKKYISLQVASDPSMAIIIIEDLSSLKQFIIKDNSILLSGKILDDFYNDYKNNRFSNIQKNPVINSYSTISGREVKLYIFASSSNKFKIITGYSPVLSQNAMMRIALEITLIIILCFAITAVITIITNKDDSNTVQIKEIKVAPFKNQNLKNIGQEKKSDRTYEETNELSTQNIATENIDVHIFEIFKKIHSEFEPQSISLYIKRMMGKLNKSYKLKGKKFFKIDSAVLDCIYLDKTKELDTVLKKSKKTIHIPLIDNQSFIGLLEIKLKKPLKNPDLTSLKKLILPFSQKIKEYLTINNIVTDRDTGFYSSSYLKMKLNEKIYFYYKHQKHFSILGINLFKNIEINDDHKKKVLRIVRSEIIKPANGIEIFIEEFMPVMILDDTIKTDYKIIEENILKSLSQFKIKLSENDTIDLSPVAVLISTSSVKDVKSIFETTMKELK